MAYLAVVRPDDRPYQRKRERARVPPYPPARDGYVPFSVSVEPVRFGGSLH